MDQLMKWRTTEDTIVQHTIWACCHTQRNTLFQSTEGHIIHAKTISTDGSIWPNYTQSTRPQSVLQWTFKTTGSYHLANVFTVKHDTGLQHIKYSCQIHQWGEQAEITPVTYAWTLEMGSFNVSNSSRLSIVSLSICLLCVTLASIKWLHLHSTLYVFTCMICGVIIIKLCKCSHDASHSDGLGRLCNDEWRKPNTVIKKNPSWWPSFSLHILFKRNQYLRRNPIWLWPRWRQYALEVFRGKCRTKAVVSDRSGQRRWQGTAEWYTE